MEDQHTSDQETIDSDRRDFLRSSVYAAYATPLITALLVESASAATSTHGQCSPRWCANRGHAYPCC